MMDTKPYPDDQIEVQPRDEKNLNAHQGDVLGDKDLLVDAFQGENTEHEMGLWEAAKNHPMACFWAFIMAFTIVNHFFP